MPLFGVPVGQHDRSPGTMAGLCEAAQHARQLELRGRAAARVDRAKDPRVAVIAEYHGALGFRRAGDARLDVPDGARLAVHLHLYAHRGRSRAGAIGDRHGAVPRRRRFRTAERVE